MQARSEVHMRFARPRPPCLQATGASEPLARTERHAQQQRPASGLRNEASAWRAPSAAPGQAPWRPQGETKHTLGAQLALKVEEFKTQEATQRDGKHGLTRQGLRTGDRDLVASPACIEHVCRKHAMTTTCARVLALSCPTREPAATPLSSRSKPLAHCARAQEDRRGQQRPQFGSDSDATTLPSQM